MGHRRGRINPCTRQPIADRSISSGASLRNFTRGQFGQIDEEGMREWIVRESVAILACPIEEAEAAVLTHAVEGMGTDELLVYTTLCGRSKEEVTAIRKAYLDLNDEGLSAKLEGELSGDLKRLIMMILDNGDEYAEEEYDPEGVHTEERVEQDAMILEKAGVDRAGTDEDALFSV